MRELFPSRRRSANISGAFVSSGHPNSSPTTTSSNNSNPRILLQQQQQRSSRRRRQAEQQRHQQQHLGSSTTRPLLHRRLSSASTVRRSGGIHLPGSSRNTNTTTTSLRRSTTQRSNQRSTTQQSHSQPSTATMSASSVTAVPTFVHGSASAVSRFSFDDETSWMSGVESHAAKSKSSSVASTCSTTAGAGAGGQQLPHYLRDGKATKRVIDDLNKAHDRESILTALSIVCVEFDHNDTIKHNAELYYGAAEVLSQKLAMTDHHTDHEAIRMICAAIEMAFRGGSKYVKEAFRVNIPNMMPPLLRLLDKCEQSKVKYADECILNITKTFHYISRIPELRVSLARQPGLLEWLQRVATTPLDVPSRNVRVRLMANLANCDDNKVFMFAHKGLVTSLLKIAQYDLVDATREYASIAIMDLAAAPANQIPLAKNGHVLKVLTALVVSEKIPMIRECATTTLQNLAFPKSNRKRLVQFHDGVVLEALLSALVRDPNEKTRRRAAGALTNLAFDETAEHMANHTGLLKTLAKVSVEDDNQQVQSRACLALTKIASSIGLQSKHYAEMLDALVIASASKSRLVDNCNISVMFRLKAREAECRESMARHEGLLNALADMCIQPHYSLKDRDNATRALMHLANENVNRKIMCNDRVLEALVRGASLSSSDGSASGIGAANNAGCIVRADDPANMDMSGNTSDHDDQQHLRTEIQDSAIRAIARLATEFSNRGIMAKHEGLITSIAKATERESKLEAQSGGANSSSRNQQQSFLGKPLLMTLLMAM